MKSIITRTISGIFLIIIVLSSVWFNSLSNFVLFGAILILGQWEFYKLAKIGDNYPNPVLGISLGIVTYFLSYIIAANILPAKFFILLLPLFLFILMFELYRGRKKPIINIGLTLLGILYIAVPLSTIHFLTLDSGFTFEEADIINYLSELSPFNKTNQPVYYANFILIGFFIIQWVSDTGAYVFGISFGKHRLFERISPLKSWEGALGGFVATVGAAILVHNIYPILALGHWIAISLIITFFGIYGDLVESLMKRSVNIKDSGKIMPGHGGILDRFDSSLLALPMVYFYLQFIYYF